MTLRKNRRKEEEELISNDYINLPNILSKQQLKEATFKVHSFLSNRGVYLYMIIVLLLCDMEEL